MHRLIAILLSDGYVNPRNYTVSFTENEELVSRLIQEFNQVEGIRLDWKVEKHHNSLRARTYSKRLVEALYKKCNSFRTRPCNQHPACTDKKTCKICKQLLNYPVIELSDNLIRTATQKQEFLKYFASCDGGVSISVSQRNDNNCLQVYISIKIGSTNPQLKALLKQMLDDLGFTKVLSHRSGLYLKNLEDFIKYQREIGFLPEARVKRGNFQGFTKNDILNLGAKCKNLSTNGYWISKLRIKEKVLEYILSLRE